MTSSIPFTESPTFSATEIILTGFSLILCEIIYRTFRIFYEYLCYEKNYTINNRFTTILEFAFSMKIFPILLCSLICFATTIIFFTTEGCLRYCSNQTMRLLPIYLLAKTTDLSYSLLTLSNFIRGDSGLDGASGLACSIFHGYLNLVLPDTGGETKDIKERIEDYESKHNVYFPIKKLFILIPHSLHSKPKIEGENLEEVKDLEPLKLGRAGVPRAYVTAVYKIDTGTEYWYLCLESATVLLTFYNALTDTNTGTKEMKLMQREILIKFDKTLKKYLDDSPKTRGLCELVYYNDVTPDGYPNDVGKVLQSRIQELINKGKDDRKNR